MDRRWLVFTCDVKLTLLSELVARAPLPSECGRPRRPIDRRLSGRLDRARPRLVDDRPACQELLVAHVPEVLALGEGADELRPAGLKLLQLSREEVEARTARPAAIRVSAHQCGCSRPEGWNRRVGSP